MARLPVRDKTNKEIGLVLDLSDEEAALIMFLRKHRPGYHQLRINRLGTHWCIEASNLEVNAPRRLGFGDTFQEAWRGGVY